MRHLISTRDHLRIAAVERILKLKREQIEKVNNSLLTYRGQHKRRKGWTIHPPRIEDFAAVSILEPDKKRDNFNLIDMNLSAENIEGLNIEDIRGLNMLDIWPAAESAGEVMNLYRASINPGEIIYLPPVYYKDHKREFTREAYIHTLDNFNIMTVYRDIPTITRGEEWQA